jgi:hypothetical protein
MTTPPHRHWFQFHLSTLLVLVLVAGLLMWVDSKIMHGSPERITVLVVANIVVLLSLAQLIEVAIRHEQDRKK